MKIKRTLVSALAALGLATSVMAPVAMAQQTAGTTTATVQLTDGGSFDISFCGAVSFDPVEVTSSGDGEEVSGAVEICYLDTESWRPGFKLQLQASDFAYSGTGTWSNGATPSIPAENLSLGMMYNPYQGQWDSVAGVDVGDIGAWAADGAGAAGRVNNHGDAPTPTNGARAYNSTEASLDQARYVAYAWNGAGTAGAAGPMPPSGSTHSSAQWITNTGIVEGTYQVFEVKLAVPDGLPGGSYTSNLTLTYIPGEGYPS